MPDPGELDLEVARWLTSSPGRDAVAGATVALDDGVDPLTLASRLQRDGTAVARRAAVLAAATARRRARERWPDADELLFTREGLEQASDPAVSRWRAARFAPSSTLEDRAAGTGGDTLALAATGARVTAVDLDAARLELLRHNAAVRGLDVTTVVDDALRRPPPSTGPVHADPGRRDGTRRLRRLADLRPSVPALLDHLATVAAGPGVAVVLSPAVDLADPDLPGAAELEFVQLGGRLVEAVAWTGDLRRVAEATATLLDDAGDVVATRSRGARPGRLAVGAIGDHLVEVAPAAVRARLHDAVGGELGARRVAERLALLTVDGPVADSPWWRHRPVVAVLPPKPAAVGRWLRRAEARPVELVVHGLDVDLVAFRRALGGPPSGPRGWRLELVRRDAGAVTIVTDAGCDPA